MVERVDTRGNRVMASEEEERKAGYRAQVSTGGTPLTQVRGITLETPAGVGRGDFHFHTSCLQVARLKKEMEDLKAELVVEKQK